MNEESDDPQSAGTAKISIEAELVGFDNIRDRIIAAIGDGPIPVPVNLEANLGSVTASGGTAQAKDAHPSSTVAPEGAAAAGAAAGGIKIDIDVQYIAAQIRQAFAEALGGYKNAAPGTPSNEGANNVINPAREAAPSSQQAVVPQSLVDSLTAAQRQAISSAYQAVRATYESEGKSFGQNSSSINPEASGQIGEKLSALVERFGADPRRWLTARPGENGGGARYSGSMLDALIEDGISRAARKELLVGGASSDVNSFLRPDPGSNVGISSSGLAYQNDLASRMASEIRVPTSTTERLAAPRQENPPPQAEAKRPSSASSSVPIGTSYPGATAADGTLPVLLPPKSVKDVKDEVKGQSFLVGPASIAAPSGATLPAGRPAMDTVSVGVEALDDDTVRSMRTKLTNARRRLRDQRRNINSRIAKLPPELIALLPVGPNGIPIIPEGQDAILDKLMTRAAETVPEIAALEQALRLGGHRSQASVRALREGRLQAQSPTAERVEGDLPLASGRDVARPVSGGSKPMTEQQIADRQQLRNTPRVRGTGNADQPSDSLYNWHPLVGEVNAGSARIGYDLRDVFTEISRNTTGYFKDKKSGEIMTLMPPGLREGAAPEERTLDALQKSEKQIRQMRGHPNASYEISAMDEQGNATTKTVTPAKVEDLVRRYFTDLIKNPNTGEVDTATVDYLMENVFQSPAVQEVLVGERKSARSRSLPGGHVGATTNTPGGRAVAEPGSRALDAMIDRETEAKSLREELDSLSQRIYDAAGTPEASALEEREARVGARYETISRAIARDKEVFGRGQEPPSPEQARIGQAISDENARISRAVVGGEAIEYGGERFYPGANGWYSEAYEDEDQVPGVLLPGIKARKERSQMLEYMGQQPQYPEGATEIDKRNIDQAAFSAIEKKIADQYRAKLEGPEFEEAFGQRLQQESGRRSAEGHQNWARRAAASDVFESIPEVQMLYKALDAIDEQDKVSSDDRAVKRAFGETRQGRRRPRSGGILNDLWGMVEQYEFQRESADEAATVKEMASNRGQGRTPRRLVPKVAQVPTNRYSGRETHRLADQAANFASMDIPDTTMGNEVAKLGDALAPLEQRVRDLTEATEVMGGERSGHLYTDEQRAAKKAELSSAQADLGSASERSKQANVNLQRTRQEAWERALGWDAAAGGDIGRIRTMASEPYGLSSDEIAAGDFSKVSDPVDREMLEALRHGTPRDLYSTYGGKLTPQARQEDRELPVPSGERTVADNVRWTGGERVGSPVPEEPVAQSDMQSLMRESMRGGAIEALEEKARRLEEALNQVIQGIEEFNVAVLRRDDAYTNARGDRDNPAHDVEQKAATAAVQKLIDEGRGGKQLGVQRQGIEAELSHTRDLISSLRASEGETSTEWMDSHASSTAAGSVAGAAAAGGMGGGGGHGRGAPPSGTPGGPGGPGGGRAAGGLVPGGVAIPVHVVNFNEISGGGRSALNGPGSYAEAADDARTNVRSERANFRYFTSATTEAIVKREIERLQKSGHSDDDIRTLFRGTPFANMASTLMPKEDESVGRVGSSAAVASLLRRAGLPPMVQDVSGPEANAVDQRRADYSAEGEAAQRKILRRGFTASVTDIIQAPFFREQNAAVDRFQRESGQHIRLLEQEAKAKTEVNAAEMARAEFQKRVDDTTGKSAAQKKRDTENLADAEQTLVDLRSKQNEITRQAAAQQGNVDVARRGLPGIGNAVGNLAIGGVAAAGAFGLGSIVYQLAGQVLGAITQGLGDTVGQALERAMGDPTVTARFVGQAGQIAGQSNGIRQLEQATWASQLNLTANQGSLIGGPIIQQGEIEEGNKRLADVGGALRAFQRLQSTGVGGSFTGTSGFMGSFLNQIPSTSQIVGSIAQDFNKFSKPSEFIEPQMASGGPGAEWSTVPSASLFEVDGKVNTSQDFSKSGGLVSNPYFEQQEKDYQDNLTYTSVALKVLNDGLDRGGDKINKFVASTEDLDKTLLQQQEKALRASGAVEMADAVSQGKLALVNERTGKPVTDTGEIQKSLVAEATGFLKPDLQGLLDLNKNQMTAQFQTEAMMGQLQRGEGEFAGQGIMEAQRGISLAANPLTMESMTSGLTVGGGLLPGEKISGDVMQGGMKGLKADYEAINKMQEDGVASAKAFVGQWLQGSDTVGTFARSLEQVQAYGKEIADIQVGREVAHAQYAAEQFSYQIYVANRSLKDAKGYAEALAGGNAGGLGGIQGAATRLQREAQGLQLGMSQLQINFQRQLAGFTAPGDTPEERSARIHQAKLEADYAQKQLDIQKELFKLQGRALTITASRSVRDLTRQLSLLEEGRQITLDDAAAQKKLRALNTLMKKEMDTVNNIFNEAQQRAGDLLSLSGKFAAEVGKDVSDVFKTVYNYYARYIKNFQAAWGSTGSAQETTAQRERRLGEDLNGNGRIGAATGIIGTTTGQTDMTVGEAGPETVAVLRNPRPGNYSSGGGGTYSVVINVTGNHVRSDKDLEELTYKIERMMNQRASLMGYKRQF